MPPLLTPPARPRPGRPFPRHGTARHRTAPGGGGGPVVPSLSVRAGGRDPRRGAEPRGCVRGRTCPPRPPGRDRHPPPPPPVPSAASLRSQRLPLNSRVWSGAAPARRGDGLPARGEGEGRQKDIVCPSVAFEQKSRRNCVGRKAEFFLGQAPSAAVSGVRVVPDLPFQPGLGVCQLLTAENDIKERSGSAAFPPGTLRPSHKT